MHLTCSPLIRGTTTNLFKAQSLLCFRSCFAKIFWATQNQLILINWFLAYSLDIVPDVFTEFDHSGYFWSDGFVSFPSLLKNIIYMFHTVVENRFYGQNNLYHKQINKFLHIIRTQKFTYFHNYVLIIHKKYHIHYICNQLN